MDLVSELMLVDASGIPEGGELAPERRLGRCYRFRLDHSPPLADPLRRRMPPTVMDASDSDCGWFEILSPPAGECGHSGRQDGTYAPERLPSPCWPATG
jgi:hypothetical protein